MEVKIHAFLFSELDLGKTPASRTGHFILRGEKGFQYPLNRMVDEFQCQSGRSGKNSLATAGN